jgi:hypothetical protein
MYREELNHHLFIHLRTILTGGNKRENEGTKSYSLSPFWNLFSWVDHSMKNIGLPKLWVPFCIHRLNLCSSSDLCHCLSA